MDQLQTPLSLIGPAPLLTDASDDLWGSNLDLPNILQRVDDPEADVLCLVQRPI